MSDERVVNLSAKTLLTAGILPLDLMVPQNNIAVKYLRVGMTVAYGVPVKGEVKTGTIVALGKGETGHPIAVIELSQGPIAIVSLSDSSIKFSHVGTTKAALRRVVPASVGVIKQKLQQGLQAFGGVRNVYLNDSGMVIIEDAFGWRSRVSKLKDYTTVVDKIMADNFRGVRYQIINNTMEPNQ